MTPSTEPLGNIAGNRTLPLEFARQARRSGVTRLVAVGFHGETDPQLAQVVDEMIWLRIGQLTKLIRTFTQRNIHRCVMVGQIAPKNLFELRPDLRALGLLYWLQEKNAHTLFGSVADELSNEGVELIEATPWLKPLMPGPGLHLGARLAAGQETDVAVGLRLAKEISRLEIGQCVVVKNGTVLAVEGFEGTDACLRRGGELSGKQGGAVAVKVAKEHHDMRFDIPCIGPATLEVCAAARLAVLAVEGGKTLFLEREQMETWIRNRRFALVTISSDRARDS
jgi:DUF1009 family protein